MVDFELGYSSLCERLETKEKVVISDDLCSVVAGAGFIRFAHPSGRFRRCLRFTSAEPVVQL